MPSLLIHLPNEEPIVGEVDQLPSPQDNLIILKNPRRRDGKDVHYIDADVTTVMFPVARLTLIEVLPSPEEEEIIGFVRES